MSESEIRSSMDYALEKAKKKHVDFVFVRGERTFQQMIRAEKDTIRDVTSEERKGLGIEVIIDEAKGYGFTSDLNDASIEKAINKATDGAKGSASFSEKKMTPKRLKPEKYRGGKPNIKTHPKDAEMERKTDILMSGTKEILEDDVVSLISGYGEYWGKRWVLTSEGLERTWNLLKTGIFYMPVVRRNGDMGNASEQSVASLGLSLFKKKGKTPRETAKKALKGARDMAKAKSIKPGKYPLITDPQFDGVMAHESFGHLTEADGVITGESIISDRKGERLGSKHATIVESGDPKNFGFYLPYDDEGTATKELYLLKEGILKNFLHSRYTAEILGAEPTGNARSLNFTYPSIVRMRNTYFAAGEHTNEELFEMIDEGIYVVGSRGGQTEATGTFTFSADRAYWVEDGEKKYPLKGVVVRGNILNFLKNIIGASQEVEVTTSVRGGCGKWGQGGLPVGTGGPYLAVSEALVGGG